MIWQNPWAWLGLGAIAIPVLIHLLGRDKAPRRSFPSLRFIEISELPPTRRTRLHDLLLLATRVAIFAAAVVALAQPLLLSADRRATIDSRLARAIIVDTSASMSRVTPGGGRAVDSARGEAKRLGADAQTSVVIESDAPSAAVEGASAWLATQPSRRELIVISDFQTGTVDSSVFAAVPSATGIRAVTIPIAATETQLRRQSLVRGAAVVARLDVAQDPRSVTWTSSGPLDSASRAQPRITIDAADRAGADALSTAATIVGVVAPVDTSTLVTVVFAGAPDRDAIARRSTRVSSPRLLDVVARLGLDSLSAAEDPSMHRLFVFSNDSAKSIRSASLLARIREALSIAPSTAELDPSTIPGSVIASWQRAPSAVPTRETIDSANGPSDGRWVWLLVLLLLGAEAWLRRERTASARHIEERAHDRAA